LIEKANNFSGSRNINYGEIQRRLDEDAKGRKLKEFAKN
jgi:hypothetical protein